MLLMQEGVAFDIDGRIDLKRWGWRPQPPKIHRGGRRDTGTEPSMSRHLRLDFTTNKLYH
ncbi:MAG TPA: hypothetical protein VMF29_06100 [Candidatus Edwardsbacteria bacterium]|nr:hypothetical protein [Candidatus Edwardsbacteria bacterium]